MITERSVSASQFLQWIISRLLTATDLNLCTSVILVKGLDVDEPTVEDVEVKNEIVSSSKVNDDDDDNDEALVEETPEPMEGTSSSKNVEAIPIKRSIPPPGSGQRIYGIDPYLISHRQHLDYR